MVSKCSKVLTLSEVKLIIYTTAWIKSRVTMAISRIKSERIGKANRGKDLI